MAAIEVTSIRFTATLLFAAVSALSSAACSTASQEPAARRDAGLSSSSDPAAEDPPLPPGLRVLWRIVESGAPGQEMQDAGLGATLELPPVAGARVCVYQRPDLPCVTSHADGTFTLGGLKPLEQLSITCDKKGYVGTLRSIEAASTDMDGTGSPIVMGKRGQKLGIDLPIKDDTGAASIFVLGPAPDGGIGLAQGTKLGISPVSGDGPYFTDSHNVFDESAKTMIGGLAFYFNLDEGDYTITFDDPNADCAPISFPFGSFGIPQAPRSVKFKVLANYATDQLGALCTQKSAVKIGADGG